MFNPEAPAPQVPNRSLLFRQALAAAFNARKQKVPGAPASLPALLAALQNGIAGVLDESGARDALAQIRASLFDAPGHDSEARALWHESVATAAFAARVAQLRQASAAAAACGGLLHRAGEALALKMLARAEAERRMRLDGPSRRDWCGTHGRELSERLVREWDLPPEVATCALGWKRFGEFVEVSRESAAVYFGRLFAIELLHAQFSVPGALDHAAAELGLSAASVEELRHCGRQVRELIRAQD